jgi:chaperonin GroES
MCAYIKHENSPLCILRASHDIIHYYAILAGKMTIMTQTRFGINYGITPIRNIKCLLNLNTLEQMADLKGKVLPGKVLIKPQEAEEKTASGIIIPDSAKEKPQQGTVILVGEAKKDEPMVVSKGDTVLYGKYSGTDLTIDGEDYLLISQQDVLYII